MTNIFAGRTVLVTGSTRNLGRACIVRFASLGANVVVNGRSDSSGADETMRICEALGARAIFVNADVSDPDQVDDLASQTEARLGPIDVYVSNVGQRRHERFQDISIETWESVLRTNLGAAFYLAKRIIPGMIERGFGRVVHIAGEDGWIGTPLRAHNVTAKAGLHGLTKALAGEVAHAGVTVNTVSPGGMATTRDPKHFPDWDDAAQAALVPVARLGDPDEVAGLCAFLAGPDAGYITGQVVHANGGRWMF